MATRSVTIFKGAGGVHTIMGRHYDGCPTGHGAELREFLSRCTSLRGIRRSEVGVGSISTDEARKPFVADGMGCLAARTVAYFKNGLREIYLVPADRDEHEDFRYTVFEMGGGGIGLEVQRGRFVFHECQKEDRRAWMTLFKGAVADFDPEKVEAAALAGET